MFPQFVSMQPLPSLTNAHDEKLRIVNAGSERRLTNLCEGVPL